MCSSDLSFSPVKMPNFPPMVSDIIARLKEATVTMEVLEVFHDLYRMTGTGQLIIDVKAPDDWPDFYDEWMGTKINRPTDINTPIAGEYS